VGRTLNEEMCRKKNEDGGCAGRRMWDAERTNLEEKGVGKRMREERVREEE
jgi:hypothetical protein